MQSIRLTFHRLLLVPSGSFIISFILLAVAAGGMYAPYGPYFTHIPEILSAPDAAPATGMINAFGGLGGFVGVYVVGLLGGASSPIPFAFLAICLALAAVLMFALRGPDDSPSRATSKPEAVTSPAR